MTTTADSLTFRYGGYELQRGGTRLLCHYQVGDYTFTESFQLESPPELDMGASGGPRLIPDPDLVVNAARFVHLLAGVSYFKTLAPSVVDLGPVEASSLEREFLRAFYIEGLGEFAHRNHLDLSGLRFEDGPALASQDGPDHPPDPSAVAIAPIQRALVPFGGGIDSIVTVEEVRRRLDDMTLLIVAPASQRFEAIEAPAVARTGLPIVRITRALDPQVLRSSQHGFLNGHVPVTGILSAVAVWVAALLGQDAVVMANEWSASVGNVDLGNRWVNHQYSKSLAFEEGFRDVLAARTGGAVQYFSLLRARSELWVAERFARYSQYHRIFRSCNRAFHLDPASRWEKWCGTCDKCCFIDLILAPFMSRTDLEIIFDGHEPLADPELTDTFRTLLGIGQSTKPFECVGEPSECRTAAVLAADRPDRRHHQVVQDLAAEARAFGVGPIEALLGPQGVDHVPDELAPDDLG